MQKAAGAGVQLAYEVHGDGPWLVFVHGGGLDRREWNPQIPAFSDAYRVLIYDMRGQGDSDAPETGYGSDYDAADLIALMTGLGIVTAHLVGLSYGSALAQRIAIERPELVKSLTLAGGAATPTPVDEIFAEMVRRYGERSRTEGPAAAQAANVEGPLIGTSKHYMNWPLVQEIMLTQPHARLKDPQRGKYPPPSIDVTARTAELTLPLLLIEGKNDLPGIAYRTQWLSEQLPHAQRVVVDAGHLINMDNPEAFNRSLRTFLERVDGTST